MHIENFDDVQTYVLLNPKTGKSVEIMHEVYSE